MQAILDALQGVTADATACQQELRAVEESQRDLKQQQVRGRGARLLTRDMPCKQVAVLSPSVCGVGSVSKRFVSCAESLLLLVLLPAQAVELEALMAQYREHNQERQAFQDQLHKNASPLRSC